MMVGLAAVLSALQAQNNALTASNVILEQGETAVVSVELTNDTEFSAFQMDLKLPEGFEVVTTVNEDDEEVLDIALGADRKKSTHSVAYNVLSNGAIRIASYSSTNATYKGTSGEIVQFRIAATEAVASGVYTAELSNVKFTTAEAVDYDLDAVTFEVNYSIPLPVAPVNEISAGEVAMQLGEPAILSVELNNETEFSAFQMDLYLPEGFEVATTMNEDDEEVLDIALGADRKKSSHLLAYNVLSDGAIRIASYSTTNATYKGTSGEIVRFHIVATDAIGEGEYTARLCNVKFTTPDPVADYDLADVTARIVCSSGNDIVDCEHDMTVSVAGNGRCLWNGGLVEPSDTCAMTEVVEDGEPIMLFFVPFDGYTATSMKRNGELVAIHNNMYGETATEDVLFTDVIYEAVVDTFVVTETIVDTMLVEKIDTVFITEVEELPIPVITCDTTGMVRITCDSAGVTVFYAINGDPLEGRVYVEPFRAPADAVISAVAVRRGETAVLNLSEQGVEQPLMRAVSRRYFAENGVEVTSPEAGVTIVVAEYEDGTTQVYKLVKR